MFDKIVGKINRNREYSTLLLYFLVIIVISPLVTSLLVRGTRSIATEEIILLNTAYTLLLGIFLGLLFLMIIDPMKRTQGLLVLVGLLIISGLVIVSGEYNMSSVNSGTLLVGGVTGFLIGGGSKFLSNTQNSLQFRRASYAVFLFISLAILASFYASHVLTDVESPNVLISDTFVSGIVIFTTYRFIQYETIQKFLVLGPRGSGKSMLLLGLYLEALSDDNEQLMSESHQGNRNLFFNTTSKGAGPMNPSRALLRMIEEISESDQSWPLDANPSGEIRKLSFQFVKGYLFPVNIILSTVDYAGEYLPVISKNLTNEDYDDDDIEGELTVEVLEADALILLLDVRRFLYEDDMATSEYINIINNSNDKRVFIAATKCDMLLKRFRQDGGFSIDREQLMHKISENEKVYSEFSSYVNKTLKQHPQIKILLRESNASNITPLYFETERNEDDELIPKTNQLEDYNTAGFDRLIDNIVE